MGIIWDLFWNWVGTQGAPQGYWQVLRNGRSRWVEKEMSLSREPLEQSFIY